MKQPYDQLEGTSKVIILHQIFFRGVLKEQSHEESQELEYEYEFMNIRHKKRKRKSV